MRPDPGADRRDAILQAAGRDERARIAARLRHRGFLLLWDLADRTGPDGEVERAMFILERAYPEMPQAHRESIERQIAAEHAAGRWHGFRRPDPEGADEA